MIRKANYIRFTAQEGQTDALDALMTSAGSLVAQTEPLTLHWYGLSEPAGASFAIFDAFAGLEGRQAHFGGQVAAALQDKAPALVQGGWERGIVENITHLDVLGATHKRPEYERATLATYIEFEALPGHEDALASFLTGGADAVWQTEPRTLFWVALRVEGTARFAIFDLFEDAAGRQAHFEGQVAAALQDKAAAWVQGGWEGVLSGVRHFELRSRR